MTYPNPNYRQRASTPKVKSILDKPRRIRSNRGALSKTSIIRFLCDGELILGPNHTCPITLQAASFTGALPAVVELTPDSDQGDLAFRLGFSLPYVRLRVGGREFSARIMRRLKNTPLLWLYASDVFVNLFSTQSPS